MKRQVCETADTRVSRAITPVTIAVLLVMNGCGGDQTEDPVSAARENVVSEAEARAYLDSLVTQVQSGSARSVCEIGHMSRPNCNGDPRVISLAPVHQPPPTVLSSRPVYTNLCIPDGRVLVIKGVDEAGQEYVRDFQVVRHDVTGEPYARFTVYWVSGTVSPSPHCG